MSGNMNSQPRGVVTNGVGNETTAHLNLTWTLAEAWGLTAKQIAETYPKPAAEAPVPPPEPEAPTAVETTKPLRPKLPASARSLPAVLSPKDRLMLRDLDGNYLHMGCGTVTPDKSVGWIGSPSQLRALREKVPTTALYEVVRLMSEATR